MVLMAFSLYRDLSQENLRLQEKDRILHERIERWLLKESEREAERQTDEEIHPTVPESSVSGTDNETNDDLANRK